MSAGRPWTILLEQGSPTGATRYTSEGLVPNTEAAGRSREDHHLMESYKESSSINNH